MKAVKKTKLKYKSKDSTEQVYRQIRAKADKYFASQKRGKAGNVALFLKMTVQFLMLFVAYAYVLTSETIFGFFFSSLAFGFIFLVLGINIGHDAAHHCVTGNAKIDDKIFKGIFGFQGLSGYLWQIRHNQSHHIFPNVYDADSDVELTSLILLSPNQKVYRFHKYQHLYAPILYMFFSLAWVFFEDFKLFTKKEQGNLHIEKIPAIEWVKLFTYKFIYIAIFIALPLYLTPLSLSSILISFLFMHFVLSIFLSFTFFISHHVNEVTYAESHNSVVEDSWVHHQVITTIDFNADNYLAHFIFGGFNTHIAHHLFPEASHIHYPALTEIIKETFAEHSLPWYKSYTFLKGVRSHLSLLKRIGRERQPKRESVSAILAA